MIKQRKTLVLDIETSPCIVMAWGFGEQRITKENLLKDWYVMSFSAKWLGDPPSKLIYMRAKGDNDLPLLKKLWELLNTADIVMTQNGKRFDEPKIKARMMLRGLKPYAPVEHFDTFLENKDKEFTSHSLDYMTERFNKKYKKLKHKKFPGMSLWKHCMGLKFTYHPLPAAEREMKVYNNHDVLSTEELYENTKVWATKKAPKIYELTDATSQCGSCGYTGNMRVGKSRNTSRYTITQNSCPECGSWQSAQKKKKSIDKAA